MRKTLILLLIVAMIAATFIGCAQKTSFGSTSADTNGNGLRDDVELEIMKAYMEYKKILSNVEFDPSDFIIENFGTYGESVAVIIWHKKLTHTTVQSDETVGQFNFIYSSDNPIIVWYDDSFHRLSELYLSGVLSDTDIEAIFNEKQNKVKPAKKS